jgi:hypothetical protein
VPGPRTGIKEAAAKRLLQDNGDIVNVGDLADQDFAQRSGDDLVGVAPAAVGPMAGAWTELGNGFLVVADNVEVTVLAAQAVAPGNGEIPWMFAAPGTTPVVELQTHPNTTSVAPLVGDAHFNPVSTLVANTWDFRVRHNEGNALKWAWWAGYMDITP